MASGQGRLAAWKYAEPDLQWSASKTRAVLLESLAAFRDFCKTAPNATDEELQVHVKTNIQGAAEAAASNTTARAFQTLLSRSTPLEAQNLVLTFLDIRVRVETKDITEEQAAALALEARMKLK